MRKDFVTITAQEFGEFRRRTSSFSVCVYMYMYSYICVCVVDCVCLWRHYPSFCLLLLPQHFCNTPCFVQMWLQLLLLSLFKATTVWKVNVSGFCFCFCESGKQLKSVEQKGFTQWMPFLQQLYSFLALLILFAIFCFVCGSVDNITAVLRIFAYNCLH